MVKSPSADDDRGSDRGDDRERRQGTTSENGDRGGIVIEKSNTGSPNPAKISFLALPKELILDIIRLCGPAYRPKQDVAQLSAVNKRLRIMCIPPLFNMVQMRTNHRQFSRLVRGIEGRDVLSAIHRLRIISILPFETSGNASESWYRDTPAHFASVLGQMPNLQQLDLYFEDGDQSLMVAVQYELLKQRITIPTVTKFEHFAESTTHFIPTVFTGLNALHLTVMLGRSPKTIPGLATIASKLSLHTLSLTKSSWKAGDFNEIYDLFPGVTNLIIGGEIQRFKLSTVLPIFERFQKLKILGLTDLFDLTVGEVMANALDEEGACVCDCCVGQDPCTIDQTSCSCDECHYNVRKYWKFQAMAQRYVSLFMEEDQVENAISLFEKCPGLETVYFQQRLDIYSTRYRPFKNDMGNVDTVMTDVYQDWPTIFTEF